MSKSVVDTHYDGWQLRDLIADFEKSLAAYKGQLAAIVASCKHEWQAIDPRMETVLGIDRSVYRRRCVICGEIQETDKAIAKTVTTYEPDWG